MECMTIYTYIYVYVCVCEMWFVLRGSTWFVNLCSAGNARPRGDLTRSSDERSDAESVSPSEEARGHILGIAHTERDVVRVFGSVSGRTSPRTNLTTGKGETRMIGTQ